MRANIAERFASICRTVFLLSIAAAAPVNAQEPATSAHSAQEFTAASPAVRRATLNDLAAHRLDLQPEDLAQVLGQALGDKDEDVRRRAVWAVAGRAAAVRMHATLSGEAEAAGTKEMVERWRVERATLLNLRTQVTAAVSDNIPTVRDGAIVALCSLDYEPGMPVPNFPLRPETMQTLADAYGRETSIKVRTQIVKTFALTPTNSPLRERLLLQALNDSMPSVLQFAAMGAGEAHLAAALPRLADLLGHSNRAVRLNVVQAMAMQGKLAAPYRDRLQQALNAEPDEIVRKTIEGALSTLAKGD